MPKNVHFLPLEELKIGVDTIANAVKSTLGPRGRNVILQTNYKFPHVTKDGVTVAKEITLADPLQNLAVSLVKQAADKTATEAGDGTTTATVLTQALFNEGYKYVQSGISPVEIKTGIEIASKFVQDFIKENAIKIDLDKEEDRKKVYQIATLSANNDWEIGSLVGDAMINATLDGVVAIENSQTVDSFVTKVDGYTFDRGYLSPHFVTDEEKDEVVYENPFIFVYNGKIRNIEDMAPIADQVAVYGDKRPLLVIAEEIDGQALQFLVYNKLRAGFPLVAVKAPSFGERRTKMLEDIAAVTGAVCVSEDLGITLKQVDLDMFGTAEKIIITKTDTTIINGHGDQNEIEGRIKTVKAKIEDAQYDWEAQQLQERLSKLIGGVSVIKVGAATEAELKEKKDRIDDALNATRSAIKEGIIPGGGSIFLRALSALKKQDFTDLGDVKFGYVCVQEALKAPFQTICKNAGVEAGKYIDEFNDDWIVYDASYTKQMVNALEHGIIDPALVCRVALKNATSIASLLLTTSVAVTNDDDEIDQSQPIGMPL